MLLWLSLLFKRRRSSPHNVESAGRLTCAFYNLQLFRFFLLNPRVVFTQRPFAPRALPRFPTTTTSSDYCFRFRYSQFSQVPLQNFRDAPPPLPRRAHLAQIESARRCWFHEHRSADHAETFNETLCRKFTCVTARLFVRQDSRTSVALCTACRPNRMSISLRYSSFRY